VRERQPAGLARLAALGIVPVAIYLACFAVHFALLDHIGDPQPALSPAFQATLAGSPLAADPAQPKAGFIARVASSTG